MGKRKLDMESAEAYGAFMRADYPPGQDPLEKAVKRAKSARKEAVLAETPEELRREGFLSVAAGLEAMRNKKRPASDEAIFLGLCRDMAVHAGRGNLDAVRRACREVGYEFGGARRD